MTLDDRLKEFIRYSELKQLAYNIAALQQEKMFHSLAVMSYFPAEGKTLFCAALAMAYAETSRTRTMVVDTATLQNKGSLLIRDCLGASSTAIDVMSLEELRKDAGAFNRRASTNLRGGRPPALEPEVVRDRRFTPSMSEDDDLPLLKKVTADRTKQYGLVILDTVPLNAKNKSNVDPLLVARLSDAAILVVSRILLQASNLSACLKTLQDPTLNLIGVVANEVFTP